MVSSGRSLLLTNYRGGGIGDFGLSLETHLKSRLGELETEETSLDGRGSLRQALHSATHRGPLFANLGLTAWGRSGVRNFLGFTAVGVHQSLSPPTTVIVHHAIEIFDLHETGYEVSRLVEAGAHAALRRVRKCDLVVFSPRLSEIMTDRYGARRVWLVPLPGELGLTQVTSLPAGPPKVVHAGYWAPYKGIERFVQVAERMKGRAEFLLGGRPHAALSTDDGFRQKVQHWTKQATEAGVRMTGYLTPEQLDLELTGSTVGLLPYTSVSGASASFNLFADRGVPVVATDLPEFRYLESQGAGIRVASPTLDGFTSAVEGLLNDREQWLELSRRQAEFVRRFSWDQFVGGLLSRSGNGGSSHSRGE
ncbi:MAG: glycosyltransferase [Thermoplasmata archaeon]|nr:glycosyltransferase [Thermoplasmata archaeon]